MLDSVQKNSQLLMDTWADAFCAPGYLCGLETTADCMLNEEMRDFLGHMLMHEMMPYFSMDQETMSKCVMTACVMLENKNPPMSLLPRLQNLPARWEKNLLVMAEKYQKDHDTLPPCLMMSLACLIMLFAGVRRTEEGKYTIVRGEETVVLSDDEEMLEAVSHLSCDMTPDALSSAALGDRVVWTKDLREVWELEEKVASALVDIQCLGVKDALKKAAEIYHNK